MADNLPVTGDFLDPTTIGTMAGAAAGVFAVTVTMRRVFKLNHPLVPFITSMAISFGLAATNSKLATPMEWMLAFLNSCMLFCAAVGANETAADFASEQPAARGQVYAGPGRLPWFKSVFEH